MGEVLLCPALSNNNCVPFSGARQIHIATPTYLDKYVESQNLRYFISKKGSALCQVPSESTILNDETHQFAELKGIIMICLKAAFSSLALSGPFLLAINYNHIFQTVFALLYQRSPYKQL